MSRRKQTLGDLKVIVDNAFSMGYNHTALITVVAEDQDRCPGPIPIEGVEYRICTNELVFVPMYEGPYD